MRKPNRKIHTCARAALTIAASAMTFAVITITSVSAYTLKTLHSFCNTANCGDGSDPTGGLLMDQSGNVYGVTYAGGKHDKGLVFELVPNATKTKYTEHILKNFCNKTNCTDGSHPVGGLILDVDGRLYGTTSEGGKFDGGIAFRLKHEAGVVTFTIIHSFCAKTYCTDGDFPYTALAYAGQTSGAAWDESSPLFGTADGGAHNDGVAYELTPNGSGWTYHVIHSFNAPGASSAAPGELLADSSGNLFGMTFSGGKHGQGVLYKLTAGTWNETILHNFCAETNCTDGSAGSGQLLMDAAGDLFGETIFGGSGGHCTASNGCGVAFERPPGGPYTVIYNFCSRNNCKDGFDAQSGMIMDPSGNLYNTTEGGGTGNGTAFMLSHGTGWTETVLYDFCSKTNCKDGNLPNASLIADGLGDFFGTTEEGGANATGGTVFELTP